MDATARAAARAGERLVALGSALVLATLAACGDPYLHNNPYDPAAFGNPATASLNEPSPLWPDGYTIMVSAGIGVIDTVPLAIAAGPVIPITIWRHSGHKLVFISQRIYALFNTTANPCSGVPVIATFVTRDTTVAGVTPVCVRAATVTARRPGSTWIVATHDSLRDSLQLFVR